MEAAPRAKLIWATTTPVPKGIDGYCNRSTGQGGCPPRSNLDPPIYNKAAAAAVASVDGAEQRVQVLDLYAVVTKKCGVAYTLCPENCVQVGRGKGNCYQIPHNVHYESQGWADLSSAYISAVTKALTFK